MPDVVCEYWLEKCKAAGVKPEAYEKYVEHPYMLRLLSKGQLTNPPSEKLTPFQQWCEDKAEIEQ